MFGEIPVFGSFSCGIDEKGRIFLPSITRADKGDQFVLCKSDDGDDIFDIYPLPFFAERIAALDDIILTSSDDMRIQNAKTLKRKLCSLVITQASVGAQRRIFINNSILNSLKYSTTTLYALGEGGAIKFFGSEQSYEKYTGHPYTKEKR